MKTEQLVQGSAAWLAYRARHFNASDAPAMMGCSPHKTRSALLRELHTGVAADVDASTQRLFDNGHRFEALARPLAEGLIGEDLYPCVGSAGRLSASFDGITLAEDIVFEHKSANADLRAIMVGEDCGQALPLHYRVQLEQQLMVSGAGRALFMATLWDGDACTFSRHCWYEPDAELRADILRGWDQFAADLAAYVLPEAAEPAPVGKAPETLPALRIEVTGMVTASNLAEFKQTALAAIRGVNRDLSTDADFADAEKAVRWCSEVESKLKAAKEHALSQTSSIDALFKALDDIAAESKAVRLDLDKLVKRRKDEVREQAVAAARKALDAHIATLNAEIAPMRLPPVLADFAGAIKGLKSFASMQDKLDGTLVVAKIAAEADARAIRENLILFRDDAHGLEFLFADLASIVHKGAEDFKLLVWSRIDKHKADEERRRVEAERQRQEAEARAAAAREQEAVRQAAEAAQRAVQAAAVTPAPAPVPQSAPVVPPVAKIVPPPRAEETATLNLGAICGRLGFNVSAQFLGDVLHIQPAKVDKVSKLFTEAQFATICRQLQSHVGAMAELYAGEPA